MIDEETKNNERYQRFLEEEEKKKQKSKEIVRDRLLESVKETQKKKGYTFWRET